MARFTFGAGSGDTVVQAPAPQAPVLRPIVNSGPVGTFWSAQTGGSQYTDLLDAVTGQPIAGLSTDQNGRLKQFKGPDGITTGWVDFGAGRFNVIAYDSAFGVAPANFRASLARTPDALITGTVTRDSNGAATSAPVAWPDGTPGTYTALVVSSAFPGAVDSYSITYGSPVTATYTQPTVTRDATGAATNVPAITVS